LESIISGKKINCEIKDFLLDVRLTGHHGQLKDSLGILDFPGLPIIHYWIMMVDDSPYLFSINVQNPA
jgi:hypothetical protein